MAESLGLNSLVTGGAGFIGAHVTKHLLDAGHRVVVLDDLSGGFTDHVDKRALFIQGSIEDEALIAKLFDAHRIDYVFHLAAYAAEGLSHFIRRFNYSNNLIGSINLINASVKHKVKCFVYTSSIAVYGSQKPPMTEEMIPRPKDPYGIAKYAVELDLQCAQEVFGLDSIIFRPHNVYGEYQNIGDRYRNVVGIFMNQVLQGKDLTVFGDGHQTRAFSYIDDVAPIIASSVHRASAYNQVFNIGADQAISVNALAKAVLKSMNSNANVKHLPPRKEVVHAFADHKKLRDCFGAREGTPLEDGIQRMAEWAKAFGAKTSAPFRNIEIDENLPPAWTSQD